MGNKKYKYIKRMTRVCRDFNPLTQPKQKHLHGRREKRTKALKTAKQGHCHKTFADTIKTILKTLSAEIRLEKLREKTNPSKIE